MKRFVLTILLSSAAIADTLGDRVRDLEPVIGAHPPNINTQAEFETIKARYEELKSELDEGVLASPKDQELLFARGELQRMGHNFDYPGAWQASTDDFKAILRENPSHIGALIGLGSLWVNSNQSLAPQAEELFRAAQCYTGGEPLEEAQNGLFFAFYYQGKMLDAYRQTEFLLKTWPKNEKYQRLNETTLEVLTRKDNGKPPVSADIAMVTCKD